jgi:NAD(P)H dehydrogenase (quinone)
MKVLTIYANPNPRSFCHAIMEQFTQGLKDAGHESEVIDLYAIRFDPVLKPKDAPSWINESLPMEVLEGMNLKKQAIESASNPFQRLAVRMMLRNKSTQDILKMAWKMRPKDIIQQQEKVARAQGLAFISPIWFVGFPAILKGWIERVYTAGFAFGLTMEGWKGDLKGRIPLLKHEKVQIINTTLFNEESYKAGFEPALKRLIDDFAFRYPGIKKVEHTYYYAVSGADDQTRQGYLQNAYRLGKEY